MDPEKPRDEDELQSLRNSLLAARSAAHDISQPLTTILARCQLLLGKIGPDHPDYRALAIIAQEAERLAQAVQRLQACLPPRPRP